MKSRRDFLANVFGAGVSLATLPHLLASEQIPSGAASAKTYANSKRSNHVPVAVEAQDLPDLPWRMVDGAKEFHLIAEPVKQELIPGKVVNVWGYNGSAPGPTIQVNQGDRVRIIVDNHLPESTSMHWHGFEIPHNMDGAAGISQDPIPPGGRFVYEFTLHQAGTFFYHSHMAMQEMMGMIGAFIMHPAQAYEPAVDKDFVIILQEYAVLPNNPIPNSMNMEFNWLTINGRSGPATTPLIVRLNDRVRIRLINLGMDHHPIHLHGHTFVVTGTEGGRQPKEVWSPKNTLLVGVAEAYDIEFVANNPGDWMVHCHLPHHMMNQMSSMVGPMTRGYEGMPAMAAMTGMRRESVQMASPEISKDANEVPGFPQDAFMEGPMMAMDKMLEKPETYGLRPGWSGFMQGMMTFLRVLPPELYERVIALRELKKNGHQQMPEMEHQHHG